jgi:hypothetical protein
MLSCICIQQYAAMHCLLSQNQSQHFSCFFATNQMIYSANHHVYLYQLVAADFICWLPVNELNFFDRMDTHDFRNMKYEGRMK